MAQSSSFLYDLVESLTTPEKAYFKRYGLKVKDKHAAELELYTIISTALKKTNSDIEATIKKKFAKTQNVAYFSKTKGKLYQLLLEALRGYEKNNSITEEVFTLYREGQILKHRGLEVQAIDIYEKGLKLSRQHELLEYVVFFGIELASMVRLKNSNKKNWKYYLTVAQNHEEELLKSIQIKEKYFSLVDLEKKSTFDLIDTRNNPILLEAKNWVIEFDSTINTKKTNLQLLRLNNILAKAEKKQDSNRSAYLTEVIEIIDSNHTLKQEEALLYTRTLINYLLYLVHLKDLKPFEEKLDLFSNYSPTSKYVEKIKQLGWFRLMVTYHYQQLCRQQELFSGFEAVIEDYKQTILVKPKTYWPTIQLYYIAVIIYHIYFFVEKFDEAHFWYLRLDDGHKSLSPELIAHDRLYFLLILFEQNLIEVLESEMRSFKRFLTVQNINDYTYHFSLKAIVQILKCCDKTEKIATIKSLINEFDEHNRDLTNKDDSITYYWLKSKVSEKRLIELIEH